MTKNVKQQIQEYLNTHSEETLNSAEIGRLFGVSRQRAWSILEALGETRHRRPPRTINTCVECGIQITKTATYCREHAPRRESPFPGIPRERLPGHVYQCRLCLEFKVLEKFAKSKQYASGYETRCLDCRSEWQRAYRQTEHGKQSHTNLSKSLNDEHPERRRAYYRVYRAIQDGILVKQPCEYCQAENSQAIHKNYNNPLDVMWLCPLCRHRNDMQISPYMPNLIEERFRIFVQTETGHTNWISKWFHILKVHYNASEVDVMLLKKSLNSQKPIKGLGNAYNLLVQKFLEIESKLSY